MALSEKQLGQVRATDTNAISVYSPSGAIGVVTFISIVNVTTSVAFVYLYHDDDGTTYDESTCVGWKIPVSPQQPVYLKCWFPIADGGNFAYKTDTANALVITLNGAEVS